jgi:hypothetical protein
MDLCLLNLYAVSILLVHEAWKSPSQTREAWLLVVAAHHRTMLLQCLLLLQARGVRTIKCSGGNIWGQGC